MRLRIFKKQIFCTPGRAEKLENKCRLAKTQASEVRYEGWNVISIDDRVTSDHRLLRVLHKNEKALTERSLRVVVI